LRQSYLGDYSIDSTKTLQLRSYNEIQKLLLRITARVMILIFIIIFGTPRGNPWGNLLYCTPGEISEIYVGENM
jgi:hypothetical protein